MSTLKCKMTICVIQKKKVSRPVLQPISSEPKSSQSLKKLQRRVELMHLLLAHRNSSFSHVGMAGGISVATHYMFTLQLREAQISLKHKRIQHLRQFSSSELSPQLLTPSHLFDTCRHTRSFWQRKALVGGHWNFPEREKGKHGNEKSASVKYNLAIDRSAATLTALFGVLIRVVATVVLTIALPGQRFT